MLDVTGFNEYNIKLNSVIGNDTRHTKKQWKAVRDLIFQTFASMHNSMAGCGWGPAGPRMEGSGAFVKELLGF